MFHLDNNSGVSAMPKPAAQQSAATRWFSEGDGGNNVSWPGMDWFNIVQAELLNTLAAAGIIPDKTKFNQLALAIKAIVNKDALLKSNLLGEIKTKGASAQKTARENLDITDATLNKRGLVQLSNATDSASEALAATPKAVKSANDNANGRVPSVRKVNGRALSTDISITAQDIFNGQAVGIGNAEDLNTYTTPGLYYQPANAQASTGKNYPEAAAGSLEVYKHAGITQIYRIYNNSRSYIRTLYGGAWTAWTKQYDTANKPSVGDIGAVAKAGDAMTGKLTMNIDGETILLRPKTVGAASYIISRDSSGANHWYVGAGSTNNADAVFNNYKGGNNNVQLKTDGSVTLNPVKGKSVIANGPIQIGGIGNGILNIGDTDSGLRSSKDGQVDLWANNKMFGYWNTTTFSFTGQIIPTNYSNFDGRYYTKAQSDARYNLKSIASLAVAGGWQQDGTTGLIIQMGTVTRTGYGTGVKFPKAFPNFCMGVLLTLSDAGTGNLSDSSDNIRSLNHSKTGFTYGASGDPEKKAFWVAFGK